MVYALPIVDVEGELGKRFFLDERLSELRNVENPDDRIELNEFEKIYFKAKAKKYGKKK